MKRIALSIVLGSFAFAQPALAQDDGKEAERAATDIQAEPETSQTDGIEEDVGVAMGEMMGALYAAEPLTAEQEARLPAAGEAAKALVPQGVYTRMMREMMDGTLGGLFDMVAAQGDTMSSLDLANYTGLYGEEVESLTAEQRQELTEIFDPVYQERVASGMAGMTQVMERVFGQLEPGMREGLSRAMATRFSTEELDAINAFFSTPVGAKYAGESLIMFSDPQVMASVGQAMPALMEEMPAMFGGEGDASDGLPEPRRYEDLTPSEQRRASEILGVDLETLRESMASADLPDDAEGAETEEEIDPPEDNLDQETEEPDSFAESMEDIGNQ